MEIKQTCQLTEKQITEISTLVEACSQSCCQDGSSFLSFPFEDGTSFYLLYDPGLVCALALTMPKPEEQAAGAAAECSAFTHPDFRRRGYFTALFEKAGDEFQDVDLLFPVNPACEDTRKTLEALDAEFDRDELRMELDLEQVELERLEAECATGGRRNSDDPEPDRLDLSCLEPDCLATDRLKLSVSRAEAFSSEEVLQAVHDREEDFVFQLYLDSDKPQAAKLKSTAIPAGTCRTTIFNRRTGTACLYAFQIVPELRGRGFGSRALYLILRYLKEQDVKLLFLQVSGDNTQAFKLYKKAGFRTTETLSYYLY